MLQSDLLESISETRYLSADNYRVYRTIMRIFHLEYQKMRYQMDRDAVLSLLREQASFAQYTPEQLTLDLQQLVKTSPPFRTRVNPAPLPSSKTSSINT